MLNPKQLYRQILHYARGSHVAELRQLKNDYGSLNLRVVTKQRGLRSPIEYLAIKGEISACECLLKVDPGAASLAVRALAERGNFELAEKWQANYGVAKKEIFIGGTRGRQDDKVGAWLIDLEFDFENMQSVVINDLLYGAALGGHGDWVDEWIEKDGASYIAIIQGYAEAGNLDGLRKFIGFDASLRLAAILNLLQMGYTSKAVCLLNECSELKLTLCGDKHTNHLALLLPLLENNKTIKQIVLRVASSEDSRRFKTDDYRWALQLSAVMRRNISVTSFKIEPVGVVEAWKNSWFFPEDCERELLEEGFQQAEANREVSELLAEFSEKYQSSLRKFKERLTRYDSRSLVAAKFCLVVADKLIRNNANDTMRQGLKFIQRTFSMPSGPLNKFAQALFLQGLLRNFDMYGHEPRLKQELVNCRALIFSESIEEILEGMRHLKLERRTASQLGRHAVEILYREGVIRCRSRFTFQSLPYQLREQLKSSVLELYPICPGDEELKEALEDYEALFEWHSMREADESDKKLKGRKMIACAKRWADSCSPRLHLLALRSIKSLMGIESFLYWEEAQHELVALLGKYLNTLGEQDGVYWAFSNAWELLRSTRQDNIMQGILLLQPLLNHPLDVVSYTAYVESRIGLLRIVPPLTASPMERVERRSLYIRYLKAMAESPYFKEDAELQKTVKQFESPIALLPVVAKLRKPAESSAKADRPAVSIDGAENQLGNEVERSSESNKAVVKKDDAVSFFSPSTRTSAKVKRKSTLPAAQNDSLAELIQMLPSPPH